MKTYEAQSALELEESDIGYNRYWSEPWSGNSVGYSIVLDMPRLQI